MYSKYLEIFLLYTVLLPCCDVTISG